MKSVKDPSEKNPTVVKSNSLIQAGYRLTLAEQRVLLAAIAQIGRDDTPTDKETYTVTSEALSDLTSTSARRAYQELAEAAHRIYKREVRIEGGPNGENEGPRGRVTMTRWAQEVQYIPDEGRIELRFAHSILPYLSLLQREFTAYKLYHVAAMRSTHGVRLYELLAQWRQAGERDLKIDEIKKMFGVEGRYSRIPDLKRYVIEPAVRDVNECSDLNVEWGQRKAGRRVVALQFRFAPKKEAKTKDAPSVTDRRRDGRITRAEIERRARPGESYEDAERRIDAEDQRNAASESAAPKTAGSDHREARQAPVKVSEQINELYAAARGSDRTDKQ
mgnify:CR=1 FL=1